jgi:4-hydroxy-tetrahydrodipicolinate reductase
MTLCVCGIGIVGKAMVDKIIETKDAYLACVFVRNSSKYIGQDVGTIINRPPLGVEAIPIGTNIDKLKNMNIDVIVDLSSASVTMQLLKICEKINSKLVICTTNHPEEIQEKIKRTAEEKNLGVVYAPNLTLGINLLIDYVKTLSKVLPDFDFEIVERHRKGKPRRTVTADVIAKVINRGEVPISSIRVGGYVGVHEVSCANENERITIIHESFTKKAFADGAMLAANFIKDKTGFHHMGHVIEEYKSQNNL